MPISFSRRIPLDLAGFFLSLLLTLIGSGCREEDTSPPDRTPMRLEAMGIPIEGKERSFFLSDRQGGFLVGSAGDGKELTLSWSVDGTEIVRGIRLVVDGHMAGGPGGGMVTLFPDRIVLKAEQGWEILIAPLENLQGNGHAVGISLRGMGNTPVEVTFQRGSATGRGPGLAIGAGPGGKVEGLTVRTAGTEALDIVAAVGKEFPAAPLAKLVSGLERSFQERRDRMESLLQRAYLKLSDPVLSGAMAWLRLSIDALVVDGENPSLAGSIPWDGSFDARENLRSFSGILLAEGDTAAAGGFLDAWGRRMDSRPSSKTYARIARSIRGNVAEYGAIDAAGWFARAVYDYVVASGDTGRVTRLFPVLQAGVTGIKRNHLGADTLVHHRADETWSPAGRFRSPSDQVTAVEIQSLWQTQQTIACIIAQSRHDTAAAKELAQGAVDAGLRFSTVFIDTARQLLFDWVDRQGRSSDALGAGPMLALESLEGDRLISSLVKRTAALLTMQGPRSSEGADVATWLTGPFTYALTRSDRQDLAGIITRHQARGVLEEGTVGALPAGFAVSPEGESISAELPTVSLSGMAEFVRLVYQDYLGVRIDAPSLVIRFEPKLPPGLDSVDFTIGLGQTPVRGTYVRGRETSRMTVSVGDLPRAAKWRFLWLFENGDGWMGAARVSPGETLTAVFGAEDMLLYSGEEEIQPEERWFIRGLSRRSSFGELAIPGAAH